MLFKNFLCQYFSAFQSAFYKIAYCMSTWLFFSWCSPKSKGPPQESKFATSCWIGQRTVRKAYSDHPSPWSLWQAQYGAFAVHFFKFARITFCDLILASLGFQTVEIEFPDNDGKWSRDNKGRRWERFFLYTEHLFLLDNFVCVCMCVQFIKVRFDTR